MSPHRALSGASPTARGGLRGRGPQGRGAFSAHPISNVPSPQDTAAVGPARPGLSLPVQSPREVTPCSHRPALCSVRGRRPALGLDRAGIGRPFLGAGVYSARGFPELEACPFSAIGSFVQPFTYMTVDSRIVTSSSYNPMQLDRFCSGFGGLWPGSLCCPPLSLGCPLLSCLCCSLPSLSGPAGSSRLFRALPARESAVPLRSPVHWPEMA